MKQFIKITLASMLGAILAAFAFFFIIFIIIVGSITASMSEFDSDKVVNVKDKTILHLKLDRQIVDRGNDDNINFNLGGFSAESALGLNHLLEDIKKAKDDDKIKGIYLNTPHINAGFSTVNELRNALEDFKTSGKWIVSYTENLDQKAYYLASVCDEVYINPEGSMTLNGLNANVTFVKGMLDKIGVEAQIIRGRNNKFKSAVEPFIYEEMSDENRKQVSTFLGSIWDNMITAISESRNIPKEKIQEIADQFLVRQSTDAVDLGLITAVKYQDQVDELLREKSGLEPDDDLNLLSINRYRKAPGASKSTDGDNKTLTFKKDKLGIIYASGEIISGKGDNNKIGSQTIAEAIKEARKDSAIKAIVLRINSPGGSALASDVILREVNLAQEVKPVVVSMGDVAASGGYYIACNADRIYAMPNTITGSIGVFGIIPNMQVLLNDKLGISFDNVKTAHFSDLADLSRPLREDEMEIFQDMVEETYNTFLNHVAEGRDMDVATVDSIGQGRVWSGVDASRIGLIDEYGGLNSAIEGAAELAGLEDYRIEEFPKRKDPFVVLMEQLTGEAEEILVSRFIDTDNELVNHVKQAQKVSNMKGIQMTLPFIMSIK